MGLGQSWTGHCNPARDLGRTHSLEVLHYWFTRVHEAGHWTSRTVWFSFETGCCTSLYCKYSESNSPKHFLALYFRKYSTHKNKLGKENQRKKNKEEKKKQTAIPYAVPLLYRPRIRNPSIPHKPSSAFHFARLPLRYFPQLQHL